MSTRGPTRSELSRLMPPGWRVPSARWIDIGTTSATYPSSVGVHVGVPSIRAQRAMLGVALPSLPPCTTASRISVVPKCVFSRSNPAGTEWRVESLGWAHRRHRRERAGGPATGRPGRADGREHLTPVDACRHPDLRRAVPVGDDVALELDAFTVRGAARELHGAPHGVACGGVLHHGAGQGEAGASVERPARAHELVGDVDPTDARRIELEPEEFPVGGGVRVRWHRRGSSRGCRG